MKTTFKTLMLVIGGSDQIPCNNPLILLQAKIQAFIKPGTWIPCASCVHKAKPRKWNFSLNNSNNNIELMVSIVTQSLEESGLMVQPYIEKNYGFEIKAFAFTRICAWLDIVTLKVKCKNNINNVEIDAISESTGLAPLWMPCAPLINIIFFWVPFYDNGNNDVYLNQTYKHIQTLIQTGNNQQNKQANIGDALNVRRRRV